MHLCDSFLIELVQSDRLRWHDEMAPNAGPACGLNWATRWKIVCFIFLAPKPGALNFKFKKDCNTIFIIYIYIYIYIWFCSTIHSAQINVENISTSVHHFLFTNTGSPFSILTGFFRITGGDGEYFEGVGVEVEVGFSISSTTVSVLRQDSCLLASKRGEVEMFNTIQNMRIER